MSQNVPGSGISRRRLLTTAGVAAAAAVTGVRLAPAASAATVYANGLDYGWAPHPSTSALVAAGYKFVVRYLSNDATKNLTAAEAQALSAAGIAVVCNWEAAAKAPLNGYNQGVTDATTAQQQAAACGMPAERPIYFSVDWDVQAGDMTAVNAYFDGVASVIGAARTGAYSSYDALGWLLGSGRIHWAWQSESTAYSGGRNANPYPGIHLWQTGAIIFDGADCDKDQALAADFGQWGTGSGGAAYAQGSGGRLAAGVHADGRVELFAVTPSGGIQNKYETAPDAAWSGWNGFGPSGVAVAVASGRHADGRLEVFAVMSDGSIRNRYETAPNGAWSGWNSYAPAGTANGTGSAGVGSAGVHADGRMEVFAVTPAGGIQNKYETAPDSSWSGWNGFGPSGTSTATAVTRHADGRLEVFAVMSDGSIQNKYETAANGAWSAWNGFAPAGTAKS